MLRFSSGMIPRGSLSCGWGETGGLGGRAPKCGRWHRALPSPTFAQLSWDPRRTLANTNQVKKRVGAAEATHVNPDDRKPLQRPGKHARGRICGCMWPPHREAAMPPCRAPVPVSEACILGSGTPQALVTPFSTVEGRDTHGPIGCRSPHAAAACPVCGPAPRPPAPRLPVPSCGRCLPAAWSAPACCRVAVGDATVLGVRAKCGSPACHCSPALRPST